MHPYLKRSAKRAKREKEAARDARPHAIVNGLGCTGPLGWRNIIEYATAGECVRTYAQLCVALGPGAREKSNVFFVRRRKVMAFLSPEERVRVFSLVSKDAGRGAAALKRAAMFGKPLFAPGGAALVLGDGSLALDRIEAATVRFPVLEDVTVNLRFALDDRKGFTDTDRAPILAKLCTYTCVTKLFLSINDIAVVPDAIGALTNLKHLSLALNKIATLPDTMGRLTALTTLDVNHNDIATLPDWIGSLTALTSLRVSGNNIATLPDWIGSLTALTTLDLSENNIKALPDCICELRALTSLSLDYNNLARLPREIGQLTALKTLCLNGNNELTALPESIGSLTNVKYLNLGNNHGLIQSPAVQAWVQALRSNVPNFFLETRQVAEPVAEERRRRLSSAP